MDMQAFLTEYARALASGDVKQAASFYAPTFMMESETRRRVMKNNYVFRKVIKTAHQYYKHRGLVQLKLTKLLKADLGAFHKIAQVEWQALRADGSEAVRFDMTYVVALRPHPQIVFFISHNEHERFRANGLA